MDKAAFQLGSVLQVGGYVDVRMMMLCGGLGKRAGSESC